MVMLAEHYDFVIGGDPDHDTIDLAILEAATGRVRDPADRTDGPAYLRLLAWARHHASGRRVWALEGTSSFAAGFVTMLAEAGEDIVEIPGQKRSRKPRTTGSMLFKPPGQRWHKPSGLHRGSAGCGRRCVRSWSPDKAFWSAAPKRSTNSRA